MLFTYGSIGVAFVLPWIAAIIAVALLLKYWLKITPVRVAWIILTLLLGLYFARLLGRPLPPVGVLFIATLFAGYSYYRKYQIPYWKGAILAAVGYGVYGVVAVLFLSV